MFNVSSYARGKVESKRRKKGLGELKPRENNAYFQMITYSTSICLSKTLLAPLDRLRIISQVRHMSNVATKTDRLTGSTATNLSKIIKE